MDRGGEFTGRKVQDYFDSINIEHWTAHNDEMKANFVEKVIQTLKKSLWGYMHAKIKLQIYRCVKRHCSFLQQYEASYNGYET